MPKPNFFSTLFGSAGNALNMGAQMAPQMYRQKMGQQQDQRDFDANERYRRAQLLQNAEQFNRTMDFNAAKPPRQENVYNPPNLEAALVNALESGDTEKAGLFYQFLREKNSYEDRPIKEAQPKMPPNILSDANAGFQNNLSAWENNAAYQKQIGGPGPSEPMPTRKDFFNQNIAHTIPNLQATYPQAFGPNAADSLYQGFVGKPRPIPGGITHVNTSPGAVVQMGDAPQPYDGTGTPEEYQQYLRDWQAAYQRRQR